MSTWSPVPVRTEMNKFREEDVQAEIEQIQTRIKKIFNSEEVSYTANKKIFEIFPEIMKSLIDIGLT